MSTSSKVEFPGVDGRPVVARLDLPAGAPRAFALLAHCFTCAEDSLAASRISAALASEGIAVLRFDFTGRGGVGGDFANPDFASSVEDILHAADWLRERHQAPRLLVGHSLGGAAVIAAAGGVPEAAALAVIGAPFDPGAVTRLLACSLDESDPEAAAELALGGAHFHVRRRFLEDVDADKMRDALAALGKALLIFHSPVDEVVPIESAERMFAIASRPKSLVALDGADHLLSSGEDAVFVAGTLATWVERYLERDPPVDEREHEAQVVVEESGAGKFANDVFIGRHRLVADEPTSVGGADTGPSPYQYLLAGLGACTSMTLRMYADRKGWPLEGVRVELDHEKRHADDCVDCERKGGKIDHITRRIAIDGDLDGEQRARLIEIANMCPVHRTLHAEVHVHTQAADGPDYVNQD